MSMTLSTLYSKTPLNLSQSKISSPIHHTKHSFPYRLSSLTTKANPLQGLESTLNAYGPLKKTFNGFPVKSCGFTVKAQNDTGSSANSENEEMEAREPSSMPEKFRHLSKEAPEKPPMLLLLIASGFMFYTWRTVLWELSNWKKAVGAIGGFLGYIAMFFLSFIFHYIGDPLTSLIRGVETTLYAIRAFYSGIVSYAPIPELTLIIVLTSAVLAVAEATVPDSVNSQPYILTVAGLIGFAAVKNYISELFFWALLVGLFGFAKFVKKRDYVSSALPVAAVLAAVGEPWVRVIVMASYLALAIVYRSGKRVDLREEEYAEAINRVPVPLQCAALAIGIRVFAKWAGYRHLTWMIV